MTSPDLLHRSMVGNATVTHFDVARQVFRRRLLRTLLTRSPFLHVHMFDALWKRADRELKHHEPVVAEVTNHWRRGVSSCREKQACFLSCMPELQDPLKCVLNPLRVGWHPYFIAATKVQLARGSYSTCEWASCPAVQVCGDGAYRKVCSSTSRQLPVVTGRSMWRTGDAAHVKALIAIPPTRVTRLPNASMAYMEAKYCARITAAAKPRPAK